MIAASSVLASAKFIASFVVVFLSSSGLAALIIPRHRLWIKIRMLTAFRALAPHETTTTTGNSTSNSTSSSRGGGGGISLEAPAPASASPFPSPSSSFLPPPTPGAHEFAVKPPPRKTSANAYMLGGAGLGITNGTRDTSATSTSTNITPALNGTAAVNGHGVDSSAGPMNGIIEEEDSVVPKRNSTPNAASTNLNSKRESGNSNPKKSGQTPTSTATLLSSAGNPQPHITTSQEDSKMVVSPVTPTPSTLGFAKDKSDEIVDDKNNNNNTRASNSTLNLGSVNGVNGFVHGDSSITTATTGLPGSTTSTLTSTATSTSAMPATSSTPSNITIPSKRLSQEKTPTTPRSPSGFNPTSSSSRPPSSYFPPDFSLTSSRPAPPSPALSATTNSPSNSKRLSAALSSSSRSGGGGGGGGGSRPPSGVFTLGHGHSNSNSYSHSHSHSGSLSRANSLSQKRQSQLSSFVLPSPLASPTQFGAGGGSVFASYQQQQQQPPVTPTAASSGATSAGVGNGIGAGSGDVFSPPPPNSASSEASVASTVTPLSAPSPTFGAFPSGTREDEASSSSSNRNSLSAPLPSASSQSQAQPEPGATTTSNRNSLSAAPPSSTIKRVSKTVYIKIRDFAFPDEDERHRGLGVHVPKSNRVARLNRRLRRGWVVARRAQHSRRTHSTSSISSNNSWRSSTSSNASSTTSGDEEEEETWGDDAGWDSFRMGFGRLSWNTGGFVGGGGYGGSAGYGGASGGGGGFPSRSDLDRNFMDADDEDYDDGPQYGEDQFQDGVDHDMDDGELDGEEEEEMEEEEPMYPGIYRALFAFEPEGTAEVRLVEDQLVRVVGRGGGVGWAVVEVGWRPGKDFLESLKASSSSASTSSASATQQTPSTQPPSTQPQPQTPTQMGEGGADDSMDLIPLEVTEENVRVTEENVGMGGGGVDVVRSDGTKVRHGLVPESYLAPVRLEV
ncbi:hypothetical protein CC1G_14538 [Coprinopsis cinerea okayama7|uniref:SH3 domain-containing protein n=1 Tax=Coprinopsis cinerea (strain Okayama-7 / 130 / ATCC MYA-4618 / FGSC 9003) TaxID=240176 RepID=D6RMY6_COPC7|nr:hypothetical protein CC1G_14538 [Coprinopsis cinerea okayama7\|eukprot:XP_002911106.1 hypothetical protein CC1G_14538 [Coprinopsis cinerea okayama7\